jgi:hypothetical protein
MHLKTKPTASTNSLLQPKTVATANPELLWKVVSAVLMEDNKERAR